VAGLAVTVRRAFTFLFDVYFEYAVFGQQGAATRACRSVQNALMRTPPRLQSLVEEGLIDSVVRQLMSGKEAMVYVVHCGEETRCAKIYKEASQRSFRQAVDYTENRKVKNSRSARAMAKGSKFGRQQQEATWQSAEVDALYRLAAAGVRVPQPFNFHDGVLLMELVVDAAGDAAPRLNDVVFSEAEALSHHATLIAEVVRMLCAGVVHGDLSEFNILLAADGPVIIDLPQAVDAAGNNHAQRMLLRDVANLRDFFGQVAPSLRVTDYGPEIWGLYVAGVLSNESLLSGHFQRSTAAVDVGGLMREIDDAQAEETARRLRIAAPG
jgi:RIO kinase 1